MADKGPSKVVGLKYEPQQGLPKVILKGSGKLAEEIITAGKQMDGPSLVKDERLLEALYRLPIEGEIGPELFELVAALLVHVFAIDELAKE
ncbi:MAG: EscU/YscU/HrcU family type III secretion system export apparatus switch protein [Candidatus Thiodiazotropha sp. (ex Rostrolucina anterorostrata)]|nr:EscU/YscU/HrcU family type III secretion system export apparatus switch protein [Candidatus Thiodiazotropha sp. (ex Rostrolucina anterorostrata)]